MALTVVVEPATGTVVAPVHLSSRGFSDDPEAFAPPWPWSRRRCAPRWSRGRSTRTGSPRCVRRTVGKWVSDTYRRRPMIIPTVLEV